MQRIKSVSNFIIGGVFFFLFFISSCQRGEVYFQYDSLPFKGWGIRDTLFFYPVIEDSSAFYDVFIEVRNDNRYAYQNLWFYVTDNFSGDSLYTKPFEVSLADDFGKWRGRGFSFLYELEVVYLENIRFSHGGERYLSICHGMRDSSLTGIRDIGLRIVKRE